MDIRCKSNVFAYGVHPKVRYGVLVMAQTIWGVTGKECVVTSLVDGRHRADSYHYLGGAADLRSRHLTSDEQQEVLTRAQEILGDEFDLILESDHYHLEFDNGGDSRAVLQRWVNDSQEDFIENILDPDAP